MSYPEGSTSLISSARARRQPPRIGVVQRTVPTTTGKHGFARVVKELLPAQNEYRYSSIAPDEIRLLRLLPAPQKSDGILCYLETVNAADLKTHPYTTYDALSYTWGDGVESKEIKVQTYGIDAVLHTPRSRVLSKIQRATSFSTFPVTENLERALRHFRDRENTIFLWVDALCINQKDQSEKSDQVSRMAEIYHKARSVQIWLGESDEDSELAIDFAEEILDLELLDSLVAGEGSSPRQWDAMAKLMRRDWFSRRWVVQELAMAKEAWICAGEDELHWDSFAEAVALFGREADKVANLFRNSREYRRDSRALGDIRASGAYSVVEITNNLFRRSAMPEVRSQIERLTSLETLVSRLLIFEATDPRDTIYSLLSIAKDVPKKSDLSTSELIIQTHGTAVSLSADYTKNTLEVFKDFIAFCVRTGSLDMICRHWAPNTRKQITLQEQRDMIPVPKIELPSWIRLLTGSAFGGPKTATHGRRVAADGLVGLPERKHYDAARGTKPSVRFGEVEASGVNAFGKQDMLVQNEIPIWTSNNYKVSPEETMISGRGRRSDGCLYARGFLIAKVEKISPRLGQGIINQEGLRLGGWNESFDCKTQQPPEHLWRTFVADRGPDGGNPPLWYRRAMLYCISKLDENFDIHLDRLIDQLDTSSSMLEFLHRVSSVIWNKRLMSLTGELTQRFGLAPTNTQPGDFICILLGCSVPVVLRPQGYSDGIMYTHLGDSDGTWYEFIGEAYIYGVMDGEALWRDQYASLTEEQLVERSQEFRLR